MRSIGFGDGATAAALRRLTSATKGDIERFATESVTGLARDPTAHLGGDLGPLAGLQADLARLGAWKTNIATAGITARTMQTALDKLDSSAASYATSLLSAAGAAQPTEFAATLGEGEDRFEAAISALNTRIGDRSIFAGVQVQGAATTSADAILDRLELLVSMVTGADEVEALVNDWFADPSGFATEAYLGGAASAPVPIGTSGTARLEVTAADPKVRGTLAGLAMAALLQRGVLAESDVARTDLAKRAGEQLIGEQTSRTALAAELGIAEAAIADAAIEVGAGISATEIARAGLIAVDPYETATRLQSAQSQLETIYAITARLSRLSLVDYLG